MHQIQLPFQKNDELRSKERRQQQHGVDKRSKDKKEDQK
jgi:hypothetical protein